MNKSIEKILVDIIKHELDLPDNYGKTERGDIIPSVIIYGQNIKLFNTDKLQITVKATDFTTYSNRNDFQTNLAGDFTEIQNLNQSCTIQIDCYSRNNDARDRHHEIIMAMNSVYAHQQMDLYNFKLGLVGNTVNISGIDGGSDINRFTTTYKAIIHHQKSKVIEYFDKFRVQVSNENGKFADIDNY